MMQEPRVLTSVQQLKRAEETSQERELGLFKAQECNMRSRYKEENRYYGLKPTELP